MSRLGRARSHLFFLVLAILSWACIPGAPAAGAEPLGAVTGQVTEDVTGPVGEVVESLPPPVQETTESVPAPAQEETQAPRPVQEVTETATAPVEAVKETVAPPVKAATETVAPPVKATTETVRRPSAPPPVKLPSSPTTRTTETVGGVTKDLPPSNRPSSSSPAPERTSSRSGSPRDLADQGSAAPLSVDRTERREGNRFVPSPAIDGSTGAPLPRWMAYVWPAIALLRGGFADSLDSWEAAVLLALGTSQGFGDESGVGPVVAGAHAAGGRAEGAEQAGSSSLPTPSSPSFPLSRITTAVGEFPYNGTGAALAYLVIVAIMAIAIYGAVRWEIARARREGHG